MSNWRDQILKEFIPGIAHLTLVVDPDCLLLEEKILEVIRERGFELIQYENHVKFRYIYESQFRSQWDQCKRTDLVVVLHAQSCDLNDLPYDLLQAGRKLLFSLGDIFPNLSYPVLANLDRSDFDELYDALNKYNPGQLGDNATKDFILRHVFDVAPELIKQPADLLKILLQRHYRGQRIPISFDQRFIYHIRQNSQFNDWPLETIIANREAFFEFLQERWPVFLDRKISKTSNKICEPQQLYSLEMGGPTDLPFDHHDVRVYIDNLFAEGLLQPVSHECVETLRKTWVGIGIRTTPIIEKTQKLKILIDSIQGALPVEDAKYSDWIHLAQQWAEVILLGIEDISILPAEIRGKFRDIQVKIDTIFTSWLLKRYAGLTNLPSNPPVMVHHIPRFLAQHILDDHETKIALVVIDGLSLDQWLVIRDILKAGDSAIIYREQAVFSWIPSLTSVSRQSIFAGNAPIFFPDSIYATDKERSLWARFWLDYGYQQDEILYMKGLGDHDFECISEALSSRKIKIAGLVIDKVDRIMHGMELGTAGMHNQIRRWTKQGFISKLFNLLLEQKYDIFVTSDHGNIEAKGCGCPSEGAVADIRGERVRVFPDISLRNRVKENFPDAINWEPIGLPEKYHALIAPARKAFIQEGKYTVSHGGFSLEEIIVPYIQIERR